MASYTVASAHTSSISAPSKIDTITIPTSRNHLAHSNPVERSEILPEHASYATSIHIASIHILLRLIHASRTMELTPMSGDAPSIRFSFPAPVIPFPAMVYDDPELHIIACTVTGSVHRLVFPIPHLWNGTPLPRNWCSEYSIRHSPGLFEGPFHVKDGGSVFMALRDGGLLQLQATRSLDRIQYQDWTESTLRATSLLSLGSFLPSFHSRLPPGHAQVISYATVPSPSPSVITFTLSADHQLRAWDNGCVALVDVPFSFSQATELLSSPDSSRPKAGSILPAEPQKLLLILPASDTALGNDVDAGLRVVVFMPTPSSEAGGFLALYQISSRNSRGHRNFELLGVKQCSERSAGSDLRDLTVIGDGLWLLWDSQGQAAIERTSLTVQMSEVDDDDEENFFSNTSPWIAVSLPPDVGLSPSYFEDRLHSHGSLADIYLTALLQPGVFSRYTLQTALHEYSAALNSVPGPHSALLTTSYPTFSEHIAAVVGSTVELVTDPQTGEQMWNSYWNALKRDWEGFVARCREIERAARWPLALCIGTSSLPIVIERERVGAIVESDSALRAYNDVFVTRSTSAHSKDVFELLSIAHELRSHIPSLERHSLDEEVVAVTRQDVSFSHLDLARYICHRALDGQIPSEACIAASDCLLALGDVQAAVSQTLDAIVDLDTVKLEAEVTDETMNDWPKALVTSFISVTIQARYEMLITLFTLLVYVAEHHSDLLPAEPSIYGQAFAALHGVSILHYVSRQSVGDPNGTRLPSVDDDVFSKFAGMRMSTPGDIERTRLSPTYSLVHSLLGQMSPTTSIKGASSRFLRSTGFLHPRVAPSALVPEVKFLRDLWEQGYLGVAREVASWLPKTPGVAYLLGRVWLQSGRVEEAAAMLDRVSTSWGPGEKTPEEEEALVVALPPSEDGFDLVIYYRHLSCLFESLSLYSHVVSFCKLAIEVAIPEEAKDLWHRVFRAYVELELYEEAYMTLIATPFEDQQREFIRHLVAVMCDNKEVDRLTRLNFVGFQSEVEDTLAFKARNTDPLAEPDYAKVLYAWYVFRGDYRSAAGTMYQRAKRLNDLRAQPHVNHQETAVMQASCYLSAINALALIDAKNAWVEFPVSPYDVDRSRKHRNLTLHIPEAKFTSDRTNIEVVSLADMRQEYMLVLSRLVLAPLYPTDLPASSFSLSADEIVARHIQNGSFDSAMAAARSLEVDMTSIFGNLTAQCMRLARLGEEIDPQQHSWLFSDRVSDWQGTLAQRGWRYLRTSLQMHDSLDTNYAYRKAAYHKILDIDRSSRIPAWLVKHFEDNQPEFLIQTSLKYGLLRDALKHCFLMLQKAAVPLLTRHQQASLTWLPYSLIDQVLAAVDAAARSSPEDKQSAKKLRDEVATRLKRLKV